MIPQAEDALPFSLDLEKMPLTGEGIPGFFWPESQANLTTAWQDLLASIHAELNAHPRNDSPLRMGFLGFYLFFITQFTSLFSAHAIHARLASGGYRPEPPSSFGILPALLAGGSPPSPLLTQLAAGSRPRPRWREPLSRLRGRFLLAPLAMTTLTPDILKDGIVTVGASGFLRRHAASLREPVVLAGYHHWFSPVTPTDLLGFPERATFEEFIVHICRQAFQKGGETLSPGLETYFREFAFLGSAITGVHLRRMAARPRLLPGRLWTDTGGYPMARILRQAVHLQGGEVTGHDHATGHGHWLHSKKTLTECFACSRFVTFNQAQAEGLRDGAHPLFTPPGRNARIEWLPSPPRPAPLPIPRTEKIRSILYVCTLYLGEKRYLAPLLPDPVHLDWQARLLTAFRQWNLEVTIKPHPESYAPPPAALPRLGARVLSGKLEEQLHHGDVIVTDYGLSTSFRAMILSRKPLVFIDFGMGTLSERGRLLLQRRCHIVPGWFDADNRAQVDWPTLRQAVLTAHELTDTGFADTYLT